jgi:4'-phosphopantetheinyl transferase
MPEPAIPPRVHVWIVKPPDTASDVNKESFSTEEQRRAARLHDPSQQQDLLRRRHFIHEVVAPIFGLKARECSVTHKPTGQPFLLCTKSHLLINLSISTTDDCFAVAASSDCPVGIDLEPILMRDSTLIERILSPREQTDVKSRTAADAVIAVTAYWTRKEAYLKLHGLGLTIEPRDVETPALVTHWQNRWQPFVFDPNYSVVSWNLKQNIVSLSVPGIQSPEVVIDTGS